MKIDSLFPTTWQDLNYPLFQFGATDRISALGDGFLNYWLGYMKYNKIPSVFFTSEFMTGTNGISARVNNNQVNSPVGYTCDDYGYGAYQYGYIKETGFTPSRTYNRYLNSFAVRTHGTAINFSTGNEAGTQISIILETGNDESLGTFNRMYLRILSSDDMSINGVINFLQGDRDITFTETINGVSIPFILKSSDLEENGVATYTGNAAGLFYKMTVFISCYGFTPGSSKDSQGNTRQFHILPTIKMYSEFGNYYSFRTCAVYIPSNTRVNVTTGEYYLGGNTNLISGIGMMGGWDFNFSLADLSALPSYGFLISGNTMAVSFGQVAELYRIYKPSDILHHFALMMRIPSTPIFGYTVGVYCPEVLDDGEFTGNLLTGDLTEDDVQPWQWDNINIDDFKEEDVPEYEPEPESGEDWGGDRILPPVISGIGDLNGFITMYGMKPSQVAALGNYLWARFTDATFWESISAVLDNTASIDPSVILNYVVSIRAYPFDLSDVAGTTHELPLVYFGRGLIGIPVEASPTSLSLRVLHKCVDSFAGGDLTVPAKYGDFRDMEPCAKLLLHVPFCGSCEINPSQVVGKHLFLRYTIDFATGGMMAICYTSDSAGEMAYPVAELHGHVGASVQLTGSNELDALQSLAGVGSGIASLMMGNPAGLLSGVVGAASSLASNRAVPHSTGKASGFSAYFQPRVPYIEIVYDQYYKPSNYAHTHGNACQAVKTIGSLHGYTVCKNVDTSGLTCEGDERIMIKRIMESGFYVD